MSKKSSKDMLIWSGIALILGGTAYAVYSTYSTSNVAAQNQGEIVGMAGIATGAALGFYALR